MIISDMIRTESDQNHPTAGVDLVNEVGNVPIIIYSSSAAKDSTLVTQRLTQKKIKVTSKKSDILEFIGEEH